MPEATLEAPAAAPAPSPSPAPAPAAPAPPAAPAQATGGSDALLAEMDQMLAAPEKKPEPAKEQPKGEEKKAEVKPEATKQTATKVEPVKEKDPVSLRKRLAEIEQEYSGFKLTAQQEREKLESKIAEFNKHKILTPELEKQQAAMEGRLKQMEAELYSRDYRESPEFKSKYQEKWEKRSKEALNDVRSMQVKTKNPETEEVQVRAATPGDWARVMDAPNRVEAARAARELFGEDASIVISHRDALKGIEEQANEEIETRRKGFDEMRSQAQQNYGKQSQEYESAKQAFDAAIVEKYPDFFGQDAANPEANDAMKKGLDFVDSAINNPNMPVDERAKRSALIRRYAGAFPRLVLQINKLKSELEASAGELAKYRKSDPGSGGEGGGAPVKANENKGTMAMVAELEKLERGG